jgi:hypothetical protein
MIRRTPRQSAKRPSGRAANPSVSVLEATCRALRRSENSVPFDCQSALKNYASTRIGDGSLPFDEVELEDWLKTS